MDEDLINTIHKEDQAYYAWVRERKNQILSMVDTTKKQAAWRQLFTPNTMTDDYLAGNVF